LAIACLEDAGLAKGPDYARLHNRLGLWHSGMGYQDPSIVTGKHLAALEEGEELRLQANLYWNIGLGEAAKIRLRPIGRTPEGLEGHSSRAGPLQRVEPFLRLQEIFKEVHRRYNPRPGPQAPRHP
jgi:hypothetical protein